MVARVMHNFGLKDLIIVSPRDKWLNNKSINAAKKATKIIKNIKVYDDLEIAKTNNPPLTVMCPKAINAGERLVEMLMEIINGRPVKDLNEIWQVEMIHRQSTGHI